MIVLHLTRIFSWILLSLRTKVLRVDFHLQAWKANSQTSFDYRSYFQFIFFIFKATLSTFLLIEAISGDEQCRKFSFTLLKFLRISGIEQEKEDFVCTSCVNRRWRWFVERRNWISSFMIIFDYNWASTWSTRVFERCQDN